ncbi:LexA repressor-like protein [Paenibacillus larvae subsp. larvae DSM 25430]|nr:LexA repressor-like protein [Paenibacillus larvae subsp. larvae DSM 25430]
MAPFIFWNLAFYTIIRTQLLAIGIVLVIIAKTSLGITLSVIILSILVVAIIIFLFMLFRQGRSS